jgi:phage terminase small subunit
VLSPLQVKFADNIIKGMGKKSAYMAAAPGTKPESAAVMGTKLSKNPAIVAYIQAAKENIKSLAQAKLGTEVIDLVSELNTAYTIAAEKKDPRGMISAVMSKAELLGLAASKDPGAVPLDIVPDAEFLKLLGIKDAKDKGALSD